MNKRQLKKQLNKKTNLKNQTSINLLFNTIKEIGLTPYNIDHSDSYYPSKYSSKRELISFKIKEIPYVTFGFWLTEFQTNNMPAHYNRSLFGEFDFNIDNFRPSSTSWSPNHKFIEKGIYLPDEELVSQIKQLKDFVNEPWKLASSEDFKKEDYYYYFNLAKQKEKDFNLVVDFAYDFLLKYMKEKKIDFALIEKQFKSYYWPNRYGDFYITFNMDEKYDFSFPFEEAFSIENTLEEEIEKFIEKNKLAVSYWYFSFRVEAIYIYSTDEEKAPKSFSKKDLEKYFNIKIKNPFTVLAN